MNREDIFTVKLYDAGAVWEDDYGEKHRGLHYKKPMFNRTPDGGVVFPHGMYKALERKANAYKISISLKDGRAVTGNLRNVRRDLLNGDFRYKQREALELLLNKDSGIILCATGYGKSWLIKQLVKVLPDARFVITTPRTSVVQELYQGLVEICGKDQVGKLCGGTKKTEEEKRIQVSTTSSLKRAALKTCDYLLFDEVHGVGPGKTTEILMSEVGHARMFGFTASLHRGDGGVAIIRSLFGDPLMEVSFQEAVRHDMVVPIKLYMPEFDCGYCPRLSGILAIDERTHYWRNRARNNFFAEVACSLPETAQRLITVKSLEHAIYLHTISSLSDYTVIHFGKTKPPKKVRRAWTYEEIQKLCGEVDKNPTILSWFNPEKLAFSVMKEGRHHVLFFDLETAGSTNPCFRLDRRKNGEIISSKQAFEQFTSVYDGEAFGYCKEMPVMVNGVDVSNYSMSTKKRQELIQAFADRDIKKVISTYTLREGVNIAGLEYLLRADGATSDIVCTQFPGRSCRKAEGKKRAVLIDLFDTFSPWAKQRSIIRLNQYKKKGWTT